MANYLATVYLPDTEHPGTWSAIDDATGKIGFSTPKELPNLKSNTEVGYLGDSSKTEAELQTYIQEHLRVHILRSLEVKLVVIHDRCFTKVESRSNLCFPKVPVPTTKFLTTKFLRERGSTDGDNPKAALRFHSDSGSCEVRCHRAGSLYGGRGTRDGFL